MAEMFKEEGHKKDRKEAAETMCSAVGNCSRKLAEGAAEENRSTDRLIIIIFSMVVGITIIINSHQYYCRHGDGRKREQEGSACSRSTGLGQMGTTHACLCVFTHRGDVKNT